MTVSSAANKTRTTPTPTIETGAPFNYQPNVSFSTELTFPSGHFGARDVTLPGTHHNYRAWPL